MHDFTESTQLKTIVSSRTQRETSEQREEDQRPEREDTHSRLTALAGKRARVEIPIRRHQMIA
eukprot:scaffold145366_cov47-Attheya_sp.AAC.2